jgi:hypothetical protein
LILAVGVIVSLGFMVYASAPNPSLWPLYLWPLYLGLAAWISSPYWFLFRKTQQSPRSNEFDLVILALAVGAAISSSSIYYSAFFTDLTEMSGLWFFLTPILQWGVVLGVVLLVKLGSKSRNAT